MAFNSYTDNFNRSDEVLSDGANWEYFQGAAVEHDILNNRLRTTSNATWAGNYYTAATLKSDHYGQIELVDTQGFTRTGPAVRIVDALNGYLAEMITAPMYPPSGQGAFYRVDDGEWTQLGSSWPGYGGYYGLGVYRVECQGPLFRMYYNGIQQETRTDATYTGQYAGLVQMHHTSSDRWDNFECGDLKPRAPLPTYLPNTL